MKIWSLIVSPILFIGCTKQIVKDNYNETVSTHSSSATLEAIQETAHQSKVAKTALAFTRYTIQKGAHECDQRTLKSVSGTTMNFMVKFDESAMYPAVITDYNHAYDVNKLYGFSEGFSNQYNSARIGWRWLNNELQLLAYVYVNGTLLRDPVSYDPPFIKSVQIGTEVNCSISVSGSSYIFAVDGVVVKTQRGSSATKYTGYQQYPYFGGSLTAPHLINIYIK